MADRLENLRAAQAAFGADVRSLVAKHGSHRIHASADEWDDMSARIAAEDAALQALLPTEDEAIRLMHDCYERLKQLGWNDAIYCPKDGSEFDVIEPGSTGIHKAHYSGTWPDGGWLIAEAGDLYPSHPMLYRVTEAEKERMAAAMKRFRDEAA